jgi:hypothetical protein
MLILAMALIPIVSATYNLSVEGQFVDASGNPLSGLNNLTIVLINSSDDIIYNNTFVELDTDVNKRFYTYIETDYTFHDDVYIRTGINDNGLSDETFLGFVPYAVNARNLNPNKNQDWRNYNITVSNIFGDIGSSISKVVGYFSNIYADLVNTSVVNSTEIYVDGVNINDMFISDSDFDNDSIIRKWNITWIHENQLYNSSAQIFAVVNNGTFLYLYDQRYNDTLLINAVNTSQNINDLFDDDLNVDLYAANCSVTNSCPNILYDGEEFCADGVCNGSLTIWGNLTVVGSYISANVTNLNVNGSFYPELADIFDIGASDNKWNYVYANYLVGELDWNNLTNIPAYLLDGDNDTWINNCSLDNSCPLLTYDSELAYIQNCSEDQSCDNIIYTSDKLFNTSTEIFDVVDNQTFQYKMNLENCTGTDKSVWNGTHFICSPDDTSSFVLPAKMTNITTNVSGNNITLIWRYVS